MIALIMPLIARLGVAERYQRVAAWLALVIAAIALCGLLWLAVHHWFARHDETVVQLHDADITSEVANRVMAADRAAMANIEAAQDQAAQNDKELSHEAEKGDDSNVGPGTAAVLQRMREQQDARRR